MEKLNVLDPIPVDLLFEIFLRVPAKSIARFRCLSKFWASILQRPDFTELFLARSMTSPRLFFTFGDNGKLVFYSSPHPQNLDVENSSLVATQYHTFSTKYVLSATCSSLQGLVFIHEKRREDTVRVIFNPITGESVTLPKVETNNIRIYTQSYLGYDPIDKQFKVLVMVGMSDEHQVLTFESGKQMFWRMIKCKPHSLYDEKIKICIDGVLYYPAWFNGSYVIVCFDVRSEKFSFINIDVHTPLKGKWTLINYKGKLGALLHEYWGIWEQEKKLEMLVLEDVGKHKWTRRICILPPPFPDLYFVGMTSTGEIVASPYSLSKPFYIFYYNLENNTFRRVNIQGFENVRKRSICTFSDYIEDVKIM